MKEDKNIEDWLYGLTPAERDELPEDERRRVIQLQRTWRKSFFGLLLIQIVLVVTMAVIFRLVLTYFPNFADYVSQFLSQTRLSQIGAALIIAAGCLLYLVRQKWRLLYGLLEVAFAAVYGFFASQKVGEKRYVESLSIVAAVYLVVRGVDNISIGWKARRELIEQGRIRLREFIDSGK